MSPPLLQIRPTDKYWFFKHDHLKLDSMSYYIIIREKKRSAW